MEVAIGIVSVEPEEDGPDLSDFVLERCCVFESKCEEEEGIRRWEDVEFHCEFEFMTCQ
jgi:hypothetical protein